MTDRTNVGKFLTKLGGATKIAADLRDQGHEKIKASAVARWGSAERDKIPWCWHEPIAELALDSKITSRGHDIPETIRQRMKDIEIRRASAGA